MAMTVTELYAGGAIQNPHEMARDTAAWPDLARAALRDPPRLNALLMELSAARATRLTVLATGARRRAALAARGWFERAAGLTLEVDAPSERRLRPAAPQGDALILLSDGVDSDDRDACVAQWRAAAAPTLTIGAAPGAMADAVLKRRLDDFISTFVLLARLALGLAEARGAPSGRLESLRADLNRTPALLEAVAATTPVMMTEAAPWIAAADAVFVLAAGGLRAAAQEGAAALVAAAGLQAQAATPDDFCEDLLGAVRWGTPVIGLVFGGEGLGTLHAAIAAAARRGGRAAAMGDALRCAALKHLAGATLALPAAPVLIRPCLAAMGLRLLAESVAQARAQTAPRLVKNA